MSLLATAVTHPGPFAPQVRGFLLNFGVYYATRAALGLPFAWSPSVVFITAFVTLFATVIAITKDLADIEGDRQQGITTFSTQLGTRAVAWLGIALLLVNYVGAIAAAFVLPGVRPGLAQPARISATRVVVDDPLGLVHVTPE